MPSVFDIIVTIDVCCMSCVQKQKLVIWLSVHVMTCQLVVCFFRLYSGWL